MGSRYRCLVLFAVACKSTTVGDPATADADAPGSPSSPATVASAAVADAAAPPDAATEPKGVEIVLAFAGDVLPHGHVLEAPVAPLFAALPSFWAAADARVFNLEAPIGDRAGLEGLALAAPPEWLGAITTALRPTAFVAANNHGCDRGPEGVAATVAHAGTLQVPLVGVIGAPDAGASDAFAAVHVVKKSGRSVCMVAWTAFLNDAGENLSNPKVRGCVKGDAGARIAYLPLGEYGTKAVDRILGAPDRFAGCDARIAYVHAGNEYRAQLELSMDQARAAARYVDAVVLTHPHVPDGTTVLEVPAGYGTGRAAGPPRRVPVFRSLGNFVSNQGAEWTPEETGGISFVKGQPDQAKTAWTRVAMLAKVGLTWPEGHDAVEVRYGVQLLFTERSGAELALRPLPSGPSDPVAERLRRGAQPFAGLLDDPCTLPAEPTAALPCPSQLPASQTTQGTTTRP